MMSSTSSHVSSDKDSELLPLLTKEQDEDEQGGEVVRTIKIRTCSRVEVIKSLVPNAIFRSDFATLFLF